MKLDIVHELIIEDLPISETAPQTSTKKRATIQGDAHPLAVDLEDEYIQKNDPKLHRKLSNWD